MCPGSRDGLRFYVQEKLKEILKFLSHLILYMSCSAIVPLETLRSGVEGHRVGGEAGLGGRGGGGTGSRRRGLQ